jgi:hypothetical protein
MSLVIGRLHTSISRIKKGREGPWTAHRHISRLASASPGGAPSYEYLSNKIAHREALSSFHFAPFICSAAVAVKRKSHFRPRLRALGL